MSKIWILNTEKWVVLCNKINMNESNCAPLIEVVVSKRV